MALNSVIEPMFLLKNVVRDENDKNCECIALLRKTKFAELTMLASLVRLSHWGQHTCGSPPPPPLQYPGSARADPMLLSYTNSGEAASSWFL